METLYNGITLPSPWPPKNQAAENLQPMRVPYLENPPQRIPIDVGRQLLVDDFLIEENWMPRVFHQPVKHTGNPIFIPQTEYEKNAELPPAVTPKCGAVWYDADQRIFKMWYMASYLGYMAYATSCDGIHWERPVMDVVPGTNLVLPTSIHPDSGTVWLDQTCDNPDQRYKMLLREPNTTSTHSPALMMTSPDGIHWSEPVQTGPMDDRSTIFYNPFRKKWVQSIRAWIPPRRRCRLYWEASDFIGSGKWADGEPPFWVGADCMDETGDSPAELYNLDAVAYESIMVGLHQILKGPPNAHGEASVQPKLTELVVATSRDGFHWHRPDRRAFIGARREPESWEFGYIESTGGVLLVVGEELWFYYSAYAGAPERKTKKWQTNGMYGNAAVGLARLRRDGFASLQARVPGASMTTRPLVFKGSRLFVNANTAGSILKVSCLSEDMTPIPGFHPEECIGFSGNSTCTEIRWQRQELSSLAGKPVRFRFQLDAGDLYSFWATDSPDGASGGYTGAGAAMI